jgi:CubicO group peptidase (beta-lactamase class C family)
MIAPLLLTLPFMTQAIEDKAFPGAAIVVLEEGECVRKEVYGTLTYEESNPVTLDTLYDLASLTKVLATTTSIMKLYEEGKLDLDDPISAYFPALDAITIRHLLKHESGLAADIPRSIRDVERMWEFIFHEARESAPGEKMLYSDLGFILLGQIVQNIVGIPLDLYVEETFFQPLGMQRTVFCPLDKGFSLEEIAPTEQDDSWRHRLVHGTVHDEKTQLLGGVAGNAGLFSTASDLAIFLRMILNGGEGHFKPETIALFTTLRLGWETFTFAEGAYGHLGFTGTGMWVDPQRKLGVILLSNRVYPTRDNLKIREVRKELYKTWSSINSLSIP